MAYGFDTRTIEQLTAEGSHKWSRFPGTLGMWVAEMDFGISDELRDYLIAEAKRGTFGYLPQRDTKQILEATSEWFTRFGWRPDPARMLLIPEVLEGMRQTIKHFTSPGSPVVVPTPAYMPFLTIPAEFDREVIQVPSHRDEAGVWHMDLEGIDAAFSAGAELIILCNPWNPTGRCLTREELEALDAVVEAHGARVFEDAIHAPLILDENTYVPYATLSEAAASRTITAVAASKGWNIPGLKCAQLIFNNAADWRAFQPFAYPVSEPTSTTGARAAGVAFSQSQDWNDSLREYLAENRDVLVDRIAGWNGVSIAPVEGTYIAFIDFSELAANGAFGELSPAQFIREKAGVSFTEGSLCGTGYETFARIIFATPKAILIEAPDRIEKAVPSLV